MKKIFKLIFNRFRKMSPATMLLLSFTGAITFGAILLKLPFSTVSGNIKFIDALFTSTSAVCVTGLVVVDTGTYFTLPGQLIILVLIQLGGLGIMTVSVLLFQFLGKTISFRQRMAMQETFAHTPRKDIYRLIKSIFIFTFLVEAAGVFFLFLHWYKEYSVTKALYISLFHSVSAFCNAGFSLFESSFMNYPDSLLLNFTICGLIVLGGIGFPVVYEIYNIHSKKRAGKKAKTSVHTKSVLITTLILIISGTLFFFFLEQNYSLKGFSFTSSLLPSLFQSITARTAGFNTIDFSQLGNATTSLIIFLMFIGASPGSCGGGIKTTTLFVLFSLVKNRLRGNNRVNAFRKSLGEGSITKSVSILLISISFITIIFFFLLLTDQLDNRTTENAAVYRSYIFEVVSAFGTVGLSMGATNILNGAGKFLIIVTMLIGRVGILTFSYVLAGTKGSGGLEYAEENIMVG